MALKLNGKDDRLTRRDFITLARTIDLQVTRAEALISETAARLGAAAPNLALPKLTRQNAAKAAEGLIRSILVARIESLR